jgi:hypothetical protein
LNVQKKNRKESKKSKNSGPDWDLWIKNPSPNRLSYEGLAASDWQENLL